MTQVVHENKRKGRQVPRFQDKKTEEIHRLRFVVQRHQATSLHYDFRLEMGGVLKSWAIPKGPSMCPSEKRLAILVEDHPKEYSTFEGVIPPGKYGAGTVQIWDDGFFYPIRDEHTIVDEDTLLDDYKKGNISFFLLGKKLKGKFSLVRMKNVSSKGWLLIKHKDEYAEEHGSISSPAVPTRPRNLRQRKEQKS